MCGNDGAEDIGVAVLVGRGRYVDAYAKRSRVRGYVMAIWNGRHVAEPTELEPIEAAGYWGEVTEVGRIIENIFGPARTWPCFAAPGNSSSLDRGRAGGGGVTRR